MKEQTAIDWLVDQIKSVDNQKALSAEDWLEVIKNAKAMEKNQIEVAYSSGISAHPYDYTSGDRYYKQKFGDDK